MHGRTPVLLWSKPEKTLNPLRKNTRCSTIRVYLKRYTLLFFYLFLEVIMNEQTKAAPNALSNASLFFGILALLSCITVIAVPPLACLAITFSWLSRGNKRMNGRAVAGNVMAIVSIVLGIAVLAALVLALISWMHGAANGGSIPQLEPYFEQLKPYLDQMGIAL